MSSLRPVCVSIFSSLSFIILLNAKWESSLLDLTIYFWTLSTKNHSIVEQWLSTVSWTHTKKKQQNFSVLTLCCCIVWYRILRAHTFHDSYTMTVDRCVCIFIKISCSWCFESCDHRMATQKWKWIDKIQEEEKYEIRTKIHRTHTHTRTQSS